MARFPKPFFRGSRQYWFVQLGKQQAKLHPEQEVAMALYHQVMAERRKPQDQAHPSVSLTCQSTTGREITIVEVFDRYQDWCQKKRALQAFTVVSGPYPVLCLFPEVHRAAGCFSIESQSRYGVYRMEFTEWSLPKNGEGGVLRFEKT